MDKAVYSRTNLTLAWEARSEPSRRRLAARMEISIESFAGPIWRSIWIDCIERLQRDDLPCTNRNPCGTDRDTEKRNLRGRRGAVRHPIDLSGLRPGMSAGGWSTVWSRSSKKSLRSEQLCRCIARVARRRPMSLKQDLARSGGRKRVDRRCGPERLYFGSVDHGALALHLQASRADGWVAGSSFSKPLTAGYQEEGRPVCNSTGNPAGAGSSRRCWAISASYSPLTRR